jgi:YD repeat-containing protein
MNDQGGVTLQLRRNSDNTLTLTGDATALELFRIAGELTIFTDLNTRLHVYPGRPQSVIHVAAGGCFRPFRAQVNAAGQMQVTPATACAADFSVSPMASLVTDASVRAEFLASGSAALAQRDLFAPTTLMGGRWLARWRAVPGIDGRYELSVGAGGGQAPNSLSAKIAAATGHSILLRPVSNRSPADRPFYVFHLPKTLRPAPNSIFYAWDQEKAFDPREDRTDCLDVAIGDPIRGYGPNGPGPIPARSTAVQDAYGVVWAFYYDREGQQIRVINSGTQAIRSFNYDSNHRLIGVEDPLGGRTCLRYDASGNLLEQIDFPAPYSLGDTTPIRQRFDYQSGPSRITKVFDPRDPARVLSSYSWDSNGNLISAKDALGDETHYTPSEFGPPAVSVSA